MPSKFANIALATIAAAGLATTATPAIAIDTASVLAKSGDHSTAFGGVVLKGPAKWVFDIVRGTSGKCGAVYKFDLTNKRRVLLYQFSLTDKAGCNPTSVYDEGDVFLGKGFTSDVEVTTAEGGLARVAKDGSGTIVVTQVATGPVGSDATTMAPGPAGRPATTAGYIYVTISSGSATPNGGIYQVTIDNTGALSAPALIFQFPGGAGGAYPYAPAVIGPDGNLYGVTQNGGNAAPILCDKSFTGCGIVYRLRPVTTGGITTWQEDVLHTFKGGKDGNEPNTPLAFDAAGNVYGTTFVGGDLTSTNALNCVGPEFGTVYGCGTVFMLTKSATLPWPEKVLHVFHGGADGGIPRGGVTLDASGNVFGTTVAGGKIASTLCNKAAVGNRTPGCGVVFELAAGTWAETVLTAFSDNANGAQPSGPIAVDSTGAVFGTTLAGGYRQGLCLFSSASGWLPGCGVLYKLTPP